MPLINYSESGVSQEGRRHFHDSDFIVQQRLRSSTNFPNETLEPKRRQNHYETLVYNLLLPQTPSQIKSPRTQSVHDFHADKNNGSNTEFMLSRPNSAISTPVSQSHSKKTAGNSYWEHGQAANRAASHLASTRGQQPHWASWYYSNLIKLFLVFNDSSSCKAKG